MNDKETKQEPGLTITDGQYRFEIHSESPITVRVTKREEPLVEQHGEQGK